MSIVQSSRGKDQLLVGGFRYRRANKSQTTWRCVRNDCPGRVTSDDMEYVQLTDHNHIPNPDELISIEFKAKVNKRAETSTDAPRKIIHEVLLDFHPADAATIKNYNSAQRTIERKRQQNGNSIAAPTSFQDIKIPDQLKLTNIGDQFLLYDNEKTDGRIIILSSNADLNRLSSTDHWHADGTFKVAPKLFYQTYSIHGVFRGRSLPLLYAFLPDKSKNVYKELFDVVSRYITKHPTSITIDFEVAVGNALKQKFPSTKISGCFFHFKQNLWRKVKDLGLVQLFLDDREVRRQLKNFACLSFVPLLNVVEEFEKLEQESSDSIMEFVDYFEDNYVGRRCRNNRRRSPLFPISHWNCFDRLDQRLSRTNNPQEGCHHALQNSVRKHPSVYESIHDLRTEQHAMSILWEKAEAGTLKITKRRLYEEIDERLQQLISDFHTHPREEYFKRARASFNF